MVTGESTDKLVVPSLLGSGKFDHLGLAKVDQLGMRDDPIVLRNPLRLESCFPELDGSFSHSGLQGGADWGGQ